MGDEETQDATKIARNPRIVDSFQGNYKIIFDSTLGARDVHNLDKAINIMAEKGWAPMGGLGATYTQWGLRLYVLMRRVGP